MSWGLYFAFYNRAKDRYQRWTGQSKLAPQVHLLSAAEAGCVVSVLGMVRSCLFWGPMAERVHLQKEGTGGLVRSFCLPCPKTL